MLCKFFDNLGPDPASHAPERRTRQLVGQKGKPEAYYFPPQYNFKGNNFPYTFMGLEPGTTKDDIRGCLERWNEGDNGILYFSKAYKLQPGTGWQIDAGILHAPGSLVTYEPQVNCDVFAMFQSMVEGRAVGWELLVKDVPQERAHDLDFLIGMLDWEANVDPEFANHNRLFPKPVRPLEEMKAAGYVEKWVTYCTQFYSAKELTVLPGRSATIRDARRLRNDSYPGLRNARSSRSRDAVADSLRRDDEGRAVRFSGRGKQRRQDHEPQQHGAARHAEAFRPAQSGRKLAGEAVNCRRQAW